MIRGMVLALAGCIAYGQVFTSRQAKSDVSLTADPQTAFWRDAADRLVIEKDFLGHPVPGHRTEVRSRWTKDNLYLLYICQYDELNLKPDPNAKTETNKLWEWDVAEAFLGADFNDIARYKEFEVSPQNEWVDLDIDRSPKKRGGGIAWDSGFEVKARVDSKSKVWYAEMKIPFHTIMPGAAQPGSKLRAGLYRCAGKNPERKYLSWQATGAKSFHVPEKFGILELKGY